MILWRLGRNCALRLLKKAWALHRWLGLLFALPLLVISITGAVLVQYDWIERAFDRRVFRDQPVARDEAVALEDIVNTVAAARPGWTPRFLEVPGASHRNVVLSLRRGLDKQTVVVDARTGEEILSRSENSGPRRFLLRLHATLFLGRTGDWLVLLSSLMMLAASATGILIYGKAWRHALRWNDRTKDSHRHFGFFWMPLTLALALTGFLLTLPEILSPPRPEPAPEFDYETLPSLSGLLAEAVEVSGGGVPDYLVLPRSPESPIIVAVFHRERAWWEKFDEFAFDPKSGELTEAHLSRDGDPMMRINSLVGALHFGHQGGELMKWLYFVGGFVPAWLALSGFLIWRRRRTKAVIRSA